MKSSYASLLLICWAVCSCLGANAQSIEFATTASSGSPGDIVTSTVVARAFGTPVAYQWAVRWDPAVADFESITAVDPVLDADPSFGFALNDVAQGEIRVFYSFTGGTPPTLADPTSMFDLNLELLTGAATTVTFGPSLARTFPIEYNGDPSLPTITNTWEINAPPVGSTPCDALTGAGIVFGDVTIQSGTNGCLTVYAADLDPIEAFEFAVDYDDAVLTNPTTANVLPAIAGGFTFDAATGVAAFTSTSGDVAIDACQALFDLCFDAAGSGGATDVTVDAAGNFAASSSTGAYANLGAEAGEVTVTAPAPADPCGSTTGPTVVIGDTTAVVGTRSCVPIYLSQVDSLANFTFTLDFDRALLTNADTANVYAPIANQVQWNPANGRAIFFTNTGLNVFVPECTVLFDLCFDPVGAPATTPVSVDMNEIFEFTDTQTPYMITAQAGTVEIVEAAPPTPCDNLTDPTLVFDDVTIAAGARGCVPVYAANLDPLTSFEFTLDYDGTNLTGATLESVFAGLGTDVQFDAGTGQVSYANPQGDDVAVPNCAVLFEVCLDAAGPDATYTLDVDAAATFEFASNANGVYANATSTAGTITVQAAPPTTPCDGLTDPTVVFGDLALDAGTRGCVPVYASNLDPLTSFNFEVDYDASALTNPTLENQFAGFNGEVQFDVANASVLYFNSGGLDVQVPECTLLFDLCFDAQPPSSVTTVDIADLSAAEFASNATGVYTNLTSQAGTVTITDTSVPVTPCDGLTAPTVVFGDTCINAGTRGCVPVYFSNLDPVTSFNFALEFDATALENLSLENQYAQFNGEVQFNATNASVLYFNSGGLDVAVPECQRVFDICFDGIGATSTTEVTIAATPASEFASNATGVYDPVAFAAGEIKVVGTPVIPPPCDQFTGPTLYTQVDSGAVGDVVCLAVIGYELGEVSAFTLDFEADGAVATLSDTGSVNATVRDGLSLDLANGTISYAAPGGMAVNLDACDTLLTICYELVGGAQDSTGVDFGTNTSVTNAGGAVTPTFENGGLKITGMVVPNCDPIIITESVTTPTCNGDTDGAIDLTVSGGDGTFTFTWDDGSNSEDRTNLAAGSYGVTVTSCGGSETASTTIIVGQPDAVSATGTTVNPTCNGAATGAIDLSPQGGTAPYQYAWTGPGVDPDAQDQTGLGAGTYEVTVTDANMCTGTASFVLSQPDAIAIASSVTQPSGGLANGAIDISVSGGTAPYSYAWTGPDVQATAEDQTGLAPGAYTLTVTDANDCTATSSFTLTEGAPSLSISSMASCLNSNTGSIDLTVSGGTAPFSYDWDNGLPDQEDQSNVGPGTYTVVVTDANGLSATTNVTVGTLPVVNLTADITDTQGNSDGAIDLSVSGGSGAGYTFSWSTGATTEDISGLDEGQYTVTVTDIGNGCTYVGTYDVGVDAQAPQVVTTATGASCNSANGGVCDGSFRLQLISAAYPATVTFVGGPAVGLPATQTFTGPADETYTGLCPGTFDVELVDRLNTTFSETGIVIAEPTAIEITSAVIRPVTGTGTATGGVNITVTGGTPPYNFAWSSGSTNEDLAGVPVGSYRVTITDQNGCVLTSSDYVIQQLAVSSAVIDSVFCGNDSNGAIDIEVTGADGPFSYSWSNGATTQDLTNVPGGSYTVVITDDATGASITESYVVGARSSIEVTAQVAFGFNGEAVSCVGAADGSAFTNVTGAEGDVTYSWSNGATGPQVNGLAAGAYTVTATDELGCSSSFTVTLNEPTPITATLNVDDIRCPGGQESGRITVIASGGTLVDGYDYSWSNGIIGVPTVAGLAAGSYTVTVQDDNGCIEEFTAGVAEPDPLTVDFDVTDADDGLPGSIELFPMGGTSPYSFDWEGRSETTALLENLPFGEYTVTVTDANNCEPVSLTIRVNNTRFECFQASDVLTPGTTPGLNDLFKISCIEDFPDNSVEVYNRWGQQVYEASGYDNESVVFDGFNDGRALTEGGYFYVLRYRDTNGDQQLLKGSLNILR